MKKIFTLLLLINALIIYIVISAIYPRIQYENLLKNIIDINNSNVLINTYSNLIMEIVPADE